MPWRPLGGIWARSRTSKVTLCSIPFRQVLENFQERGTFIPVKPRRPMGLLKVPWQKLMCALQVWHQAERLSGIARLPANGANRRTLLRADGKALILFLSSPRRISGGAMTSVLSVTRAFIGLSGRMAGQRSAQSCGCVEFG